MEGIAMKRPMVLFVLVLSFFWGTSCSRKGESVSPERKALYEALCKVEKGDLVEIRTGLLYVTFQVDRDMKRVIISSFYWSTFVSIRSPEAVPSCIARVIFKTDAGYTEALKKFALQ